MRLSLLYIFLFFLICPLAASPGFTHPLTLTELVTVALDNHPSTQQSWWNAKRAAAAVGIAKSAYYPKVNFEAHGQHGRDFKFINGPETNYTIVGADLVFSMLLFDTGERAANVNTAQMALIAANWQTDWTIQKVMVKVLEHAYSTLHAQEVFQSSQSSVEDAEQTLYAAQELNRAGLTPVSDVYIAQAALSQMKMDLLQQKALLQIQKGKLAVSLGLPSFTSIELIPLEAMHVPQAPKVEELVTLALSQRADFMAKQAKVCESFSNRDKVRAAYGPKVSLSGRSGAHYALHDKTDGAQYQIALNLEIPLFNGFETQYRKRLAYAEANLTLEEKVELQLDISLEVLTYSRLLTSYQEMLPEAVSHLENSIKAYESVLEKYRAGKERMSDVSQAQQQLAAARIRYSDVKTRWLVSIANLAYATGTLCPI